jgi:ribonuclease HI
MWTDGSCLGNPGPMAWCAILDYNGTRKEITPDVLVEGTNNRAELLAVIGGLKALREPCEVVVTSDSQYVVKGVNEWDLPDKGRCEQCTNADLWGDVYTLIYESGHKVKFIWQRGHAGHRENERCNAVAEGLLHKLQGEPK